LGSAQMLGHLRLGNTLSASGIAQQYGEVDEAVDIFADGDHLWSTLKAVEHSPALTLCEWILTRFFESSQAGIKLC
jgi:hypothetical protein